MHDMQAGNVHHTTNLYNSACRKQLGTYRLLEFTDRHLFRIEALVGPKVLHMCEINGPRYGRSSGGGEGGEGGRGREGKRGEGEGGIEGGIEGGVQREGGKEGREGNALVLGT